jgi:hypothetical protein
MLTDNEEVNDKTLALILSIIKNAKGKEAGKKERLRINR